MKKVFYILTILILFFALISIPSVSSAAALTTVTTEVSRAKIAPGEQVKLTVKFGRSLGAYTINADYDKNIFEYVSSEGGTANDTGDQVILTYHDTAGGTNPRANATITFKAKSDLTASNPTDISVTLEGLANNNASETYDDITTPIKANVLVEPNYVDYSLTLDYTGEITKNVGKDMKLITASTMGKNYDHVKLLAEVTSKPEDTATSKLIAIKDGTETDILVDGFGGTDGYSLGGKNVKQELALRGEFSTDGKYTIKVKLVNLENNNATIAEKSFDVIVGKITTQKPSTDEKLPSKYPQTGTTQYMIIATIIVALVVAYFVVDKARKNNH